jgi:hypothetical protein
MAGPNPHTGKLGSDPPLLSYLLNDERLSATALTGAVLIMAAIVAVEIVPRLRPPRPLPEG